jgi:glycosyltransferase involved in cell wall biosynthesis
MDFVSTLDILERDFMERKSVAYADAVVSPSLYMLQWLADQKWELPEKVYVQPNIITDELTAEYDPENIGVRELVFFGRLEKRKGLDLFCRAIDILAAASEASQPISITFLGKQETVEGRKSGDYIAKRTEQWPFPIRVISDLNRDGALAYLQEGGRLAVIPSLVDNFPYTVLECCGAGIPFLASATGGIPEVIAPEDRERTCFETRPGALSEMLTRAIRKGVRRARPAVEFEAVRKAWINWHQVLHASLAAPLSTEGDVAGPRTDPPLVSVCMTTFNRPRLLAQALESLRGQDYTKFEVVLVDDGSREPPALAYLDELEAEFSSKGWTIIRQENKYPGAARNNAARHSAGEYLLFMDDDNYAEPHEISTFIRVAQHTGADILTCPAKRFLGDSAPSGPPDHIWLPLGAAADVGVLRNCYGDVNALVRREAFEALGGFMEDYGLGHEDHEFFARAVLKGFHLEVVPEELFWYRIQKNNVTLGTRHEANMVRVLRPYLEAMPTELRGVVRLLQGLHQARTIESIADQVYVYYKTVPRAEFLKTTLISLWRVARKLIRDIF